MQDKLWLLYSLWTKNLVYLAIHTAREAWVLRVYMQGPRDVQHGGVLSVARGLPWLDDKLPAPIPAALLLRLDRLDQAVTVSATASTAAISATAAAVGSCGHREC